MKEHDKGCDGVERYTDGIFHYCECAAYVMKVVVGVKMKLRK